jgi:hypothetical protein
MIHLIILSMGWHRILYSTPPIRTVRSGRSEPVDQRSKGKPGAVGSCTVHKSGKLNLPGGNAELLISNGVGFPSAFLVWFSNISQVGENLIRDLFSSGNSFGFGYILHIK